MSPIFILLNTKNKILIKNHLIFNDIKITPVSRLKRGATYLPSKDGKSSI